MRIMEQVKELMEGLGQKVQKQPTLENFPFKLRAKLVLEEALEFVEACGFTTGVSGVSSSPTVRPKSFELYEHGRGMDWVEMVDALGDIFVVTAGAFLSMGVDPVPILEEIHRSNMAKIGGPKDADGKGLKPEGWTPPDLKRVLEEMMFRTDESEP